VSPVRVVARSRRAHRHLRPDDSNLLAAEAVVQVELGLSDVVRIPAVIAERVALIKAVAPASAWRRQRRTAVSPTYFVINPSRSTVIGEVRVRPGRVSAQKGIVLS
jgi:hypothetical protein